MHIYILLCPFLDAIKFYLIYLIFTMKISCRCHRLLIYDMKETIKLDGMGPLNCHSL